MRSPAPNKTRDYLLSLRDLSYPHYFCLLLTDYQTWQVIARFWQAAAEIRRIPTIIQEATAGYLRLAWWRDQYNDPDSINFINAYEFWFEPQSLEKAIEFAGNSEYFFVRQTLKLLNLAVNENITFHFGRCFGLILIFQNQGLLDFTLSTADKDILKNRFDESLTVILSSKTQQRDLHLLRPLVGYLKLWQSNYSGNPITFGLMRIQWNLLMLEWLG